MTTRDFCLPNEHPHDNKANDRHTSCPAQTHRSNCPGVSGGTSEDGRAIETKSNSRTPGTRSVRPILKNPSVMPLCCFGAVGRFGPRRGRGRERRCEERSNGIFRGRREWGRGLRAEPESIQGRFVLSTQTARIRFVFRPVVRTRKIHYISLLESRAGED